MQASLIIPTRNRANSIKRLVGSLDSLVYPDSVLLEVLVVDNGSADETAEYLKQEEKKPRKFELKILREQRTGKTNALNLGLGSAAGRIILVVDDDVVLDPNWLVGHLDCYEATPFQAVQGRVMPGVDPEGRPADLQRLREYNIPIIDYGDDFCELRGLTGTNMSFKREVFEKIGFFDTRLGPGAAGFSEDTEYSIRIREAGFKIGYTPHAIVFHELDPGRYGRAYNRRVEYRKGLSRSIYRHDSIMFKVMPNLMANCFRYGIYCVTRKAQKAYKTEGRIMKCWGYLMGKAQGVKLRRDRSRA